MKKIILLFLLFSITQFVGCSKRILTPVINRSSELGWRQRNSHQTVYYNSNDVKDGITSSMKTTELISVKPSGFCAITKGVCYSRRMLEFYLSGHIYSDEPFLFSTQSCISVFIDDKFAFALPSEQIEIAGKKGLRQTKVNLFLPKAIKKDNELSLQIKFGDDTHYFTLSRQHDDELFLSSIPYYPILVEQSIVNK